MTELNLQQDQHAHNSVRVFQNDYFANHPGQPTNGGLISPTGWSSNTKDPKSLAWQAKPEKVDIMRVSIRPRTSTPNDLSGQRKEKVRQLSTKPESKQQPLSNLHQLQRPSLKHNDKLNAKDLKEAADYPNDTDEFGVADSKQLDGASSGDASLLTLSKQRSDDKSRFSATLPTALPKRREVPHIANLSVKKQDSFQEQIQAASENSVIILPAKTIRIPSLRISTSITIKGSPGTVLEITEGPIVIDLDDSIVHDRRVIFCECTVYFDLSRQRILDNINTRSDSNTRRGGPAHKEIEDSFKTLDKKSQFGLQTINEGNKSYHYSSATSRSQQQEGNQFSLFLIKSNSILEVRDCQLKSLVKKNLLYTEEAKYLNEIHDVCFQLQANSTSISGNRPRRHGTLYLKSTTISYFASFIQMESYTSLYAQRCFFSESRGHSINVANPKTLKIAESIFEKSEKSSINIRFSRDLNEETARNITILENELLNSHSYGISIFGENLKHQNLTFVIMKNRIFHSKKDSIGIKFLNVSDLKILNNEIKSSKGNGIYIHNVYDSISNKQVVVSENRVTLSDSNGMLIKDSSCLLESNEIAQNNKNGVHIANSDSLNAEEYSFYKKNSMKLFLNNCRIFGNTETGVFISGILKGPMIINSCVLNENLHGVMVNEKEVQNYSFVASSDDKTKQAQAKVSKQFGGSQRFAHILIEKSELLRNIVAGITLRNLWSDLFVSENMMSGNKEYAIWIENVTDKNHLKLKDLERGRLREFIQGYVGGAWGDAYEEKGGACKGTTCSIF